MYNNSLESKVIEIQSRVAGAKATLESAHSKVLATEQAKANINISDYQYTVDVTQYGGQAYNEALDQAKQRVANALSSQESHQSSLTAAVQTETTIQQSFNLVNQKWTTANNTLASYKSSLDQAQIFWQQASQRANQSININNYPYQDPVTKYGGSAYERARDQAQQKIDRVNNTLSSYQNNLNQAQNDWSAKQNSVNSIYNRWSSANNTLASYKSSLSSAQTTLQQAEQQAKQTIKPEHYPYQVDVERRVSTKKLFHSSKLKTFSETRYDGGDDYKNALQAATKYQQAQVSSWQTQVNSAQTEFNKVNTEYNNANSQLTQAKNNVAYYQKLLQQVQTELNQAQQAHSQININNYTYTVQETKYGGDKYNQALQAAIKTEQDKAQVEVTRWQTQVNSAQATLNQANIELNQANSELTAAKNTVEACKSLLEQAKSELELAQKAETEIDINNYTYTVQETKHGGEEYEKAVIQADEDLAEAKILEESCQQALDMALKEEVEVLEEIAQHASNIEIQNTDIQNADTQNIDLLEQECIDHLYIDNLEDNQIKEIKFYGSMQNFWEYKG